MHLFQITHRLVLVVAFCLFNVAVSMQRDVKTIGLQGGRQACNEDLSVAFMQLELAESLPDSLGEFEQKAALKNFESAAANNDPVGLYMTGQVEKAADLNYGPAQFSIGMNLLDQALLDPKKPDFKKVEVARGLLERVVENKPVHEDFFYSAAKFFLNELRRDFKSSGR